jgi:hypothetical protein
MNIVPINDAGKHKTGSIDNYSRAQIIEVLGFEPNVDDDPDKVVSSWGFTADGERCGIWDYKGSHYSNSWSWFGPTKILNMLFPE